jgi:hypothetical protein
MTRPTRKRRFAFPGLERLESRCLLAGSPSAVWLGQDGHDFVGGATPGAGNGVQDVHIALSNLPANLSIATVEVIGDGGGEWVVNIGPYNQYNGDLFRTPSATTADLYIDPYQVETGRKFFVTLGYNDGTSANFQFEGGTANPNLWMPADAVSTTWVGQDGKDLTGLGPSVGPDGFVDAHLTLSHLYSGSAISDVTVTRASGTGWSSGLNPGLLNNADFIPDNADPTSGDLYFSPDTNLAGQVMTVTVTYADGKVAQSTLTAGPTNPTLPDPAPAPVTITWGTFQVQWLGQDGLALSGPGDVHLALSGLPAGRTVVSATLSDEAGFDWFSAQSGSGITAADPNAQPLGFRTSADPTRLDLGFGPVRDETGATLTVLLTLDDGSRLATRINGNSCDPSLRAPDIAATSVVAYPGDDLNDLAARYGTVRLTAGLYPMDQPLVLGRPVTITAGPGVTLLFAQAPTAPTWTAAIKVLVSHVTLNGFAVRFAGPVRWTTNISFGPAVIGTIDNFDAWVNDPRVDLTFTDLDLQIPPPSSSWEEAPSLFRLNSGSCGRIADNLLKGGTTEVENGPWLIAGNTYIGTLPDTYAYQAFGGQNTHDVTITDNHVEPVGPSGKTWRFLTMTQSGLGDTVLDNTVVGIGMLDTDTVANPNCPELLLTEAYQLHYEGQLASVSSDGRVVQIYAPQGRAARTGDVLAILSGPQAGQWRMIAQVIGPNTYVLDGSITPGKFAVSLATGFVNETYQGNTIDASGSTLAQDFVLAGNQYGARIVGNTLIGGQVGFRLVSTASEAPVVWGWSHTPFLGATIMGNTVENSVLGSQIDVERNAYTKSGAGRVEFTGSFVLNTGLWTSAFLAQRSALGVTTPPVLVTVGNALCADPGELVLTESGNQVGGPSSVVSGPTIEVVAATLNGQSTRNQGVVLSVVPGPLSSSIAIATGPAPKAAAVVATPGPPAAAIVPSKMPDVADPPPSQTAGAPAAAAPRPVRHAWKRPVPAPPRRTPRAAPRPPAAQSLIPRRTGATHPAAREPSMPRIRTYHH